MNINGFTWLLLAFPVFLLARGKFAKYVELGSSEEATQ